VLVDKVSGDNSAVESKMCHECLKVQVIVVLTLRYVHVNVFYDYNLWRSTWVVRRHASCYSGGTLRAKRVMDDVPWVGCKENFEAC
jgi:hypothetical protein